MFTIDVIFHWADTLTGRMLATTTAIEALMRGIFTDLIGPTIIQPFSVKGCSVAIIAECEIRDPAVVALDLNALGEEIEDTVAVIFSQQFGEVLIDLAIVTYCVSER